MTTWCGDETLHHGPLWKCCEDVPWADMDCLCLAATTRSNDNCGGLRTLSAMRDDACRYDPKSDLVIMRRQMWV
jgi:hypothetical protein